MSILFMSMMTAPRVEGGGLTLSGGNLNDPPQGLDRAKSYWPMDERGGTRYDLKQ